MPGRTVSLAHSRDLRLQTCSNDKNIGRASPLTIARKGTHLSKDTMRKRSASHVFERVVAEQMVF